MQNREFLIVNFHGIGTPRRSLEDGEERYWIGEEQFRQMLDQIVPFKQGVFLTFDDGNRSDLDVGAMELKKRGMLATFFPLAGRLNEKGSLSAADLRELVSLGNRIGSHGYDHVSWKNLDEIRAQKELVEAKATLEDCVGMEITDAAIPFGQYGRTTLKFMRAAGYQRGYSSDGGSFRGEPFPIPRWSVRADTSKKDMADFLAGRESFGRRARRSLAKMKKKIL